MRFVLHIFFILSKRAAREERFCMIQTTSQPPTEPQYLLMPPHSTLQQRRRRNILVLFIAILAIVILVHQHESSSGASRSSRRHDALQDASSSSGDPQRKEAAELKLDGKSIERRNIFPPRDARYQATKHLIIVPGHGVFRGAQSSDWKKESLWGLEPFQKNGPGDGLLTVAFSQHIKRGVQELLKHSETSLLIFSGGQTKLGAGPRSEALSYYIIAEETKLFGLFSHLEAEVEQKEVDTMLEHRVFAEEYARDSYENVLYSICRFHEVTGSYPEKITVVNWEYKRTRFESLHRAAIRFHQKAFNFIGIDFVDALQLAGIKLPPGRIRTFSDQLTLDRVKKDMYVCQGHEATRKTRNPNFRVIPYITSCPELARLLVHCGPALFEEALPWD